MYVYTKINTHMIVCIIIINHMKKTYINTHINVRIHNYNCKCTQFIISHTIVCIHKYKYSYKCLYAGIK